MLDYVVVFHSGGLILFEKFFAGNKQKEKIQGLVQKFLNEVFLAEKEKDAKQIKMDKKIFQYVYDKSKQIITLLVYSEMVSDLSFDQFLQNFDEIYKAKYLKQMKKNNLSLVDLSLKREEVNENLNVLLKITKFENKDQQPKKKKWENKKKKPKKEKDNSKQRVWDPALASK